MPSPSTRGTSRRTPRRPPADLDDNTVNDTMSPASTSSNPRYTCNESDLPVFLPQLHQYITACNSKYVALCQHRYVTTGRYICTTSLNHIDRLIDGSFTKGTLFKPSTVKPQSLVDLAPIKGAVTLAKDGPSMTKGEPSDSSYTVNNATITDLDLALLTDILECYDDEETREEDEKTANGSGTALLLILSTRRIAIATKTQNYGASIDAAYDSLIKEGITSPRVDSNPTMYVGTIGTGCSVTYVCMYAVRVHAYSFLLIGVCHSPSPSS